MPELKQILPASQHSDAYFYYAKVIHEQKDPEVTLAYLEEALKLKKKHQNSEESKAGESSNQGN